MTQSPVQDQNVQYFLRGLDELSYRLGEAPVQEESALCMVCMRWATDGPECRDKYRCEDGIAEVGQPYPHF